MFYSFPPACLDWAKTLWVSGQHAKYFVPGNVSYMVWPIWIQRQSFSGKKVSFFFKSVFFGGQGMFKKEHNSEGLWHNVTCANGFFDIRLGKNMVVYSDWFYGC